MANKSENSTTVIHAGEQRKKPAHRLTTPIFQTSTYTFDSTADLTDFLEARLWGEAGERHEDARYGNTTVRAAEKKLAAMENAEDAVLVSSGMAGITSTLLTFLAAGRHIICTEES